MNGFSWLRHVGRMADSAIRGLRWPGLKPKHGKPVGPKLIVGRGLKRRRRRAWTERTTLVVVLAITALLMVAVLMQFYSVAN